MNNKIAVILALADVKYSLNDLEKHYKTFCGLYTICFVLTGVKYSQSDLGKHYKTFCGL